ncbi:tail fiber domain-containing protein [Saccharicrinis sp. FJH62]|uniref:tail fiber domain-containing protein n=1 Tax=Saccharicrinis sp. FJH62 TaxID=3344657 RepID=UPI0035D506C7
MRKLYAFLIGLLLTSLLWAQSPEKMSYQAVVRNSDSELVINSSIGMQISIIQGSVSGTSVYVERHFPTTNENGLVSLEIGTGTIISGVFADIDWSAGPYFMKTETDLNGGANYTITGIKQLLSVPYALYAKEAGNKDDADADPENELQSISLDGDQLTLSNGGSVTLPKDTLAFISSDGITHNANLTDNFVFGSTSLDSLQGNEDDARMFFNKAKGSFRAGTAVGSEWNDDNIGVNSFASGLNNIASGNGSTAIGINTTASGGCSLASGFKTSAIGSNSLALGYETLATGPSCIALGLNTTATSLSSFALGTHSSAYNNFSTAIGYYSEAQGVSSVAIGRGVTAYSFNEIVFGQNNTSYTPENTSNWDEADRLFVIGNGTSNPSDALTVLKSGNVGIGDSNPFQKLSVNGMIYSREEGFMFPDGTVQTTAVDPIRGIKIIPNILIGESAGEDSDSTRYIIAIGDFALYNNGIGATQNYHATANTGIGYRSLCYNTTGYKNTANGFTALFSNTEGHDNTANGYRALFINATGNQNTASGSLALCLNTYGSDNTANGCAALYSNTIGSNNTANGRHALYSNTEGQDNTANGYYALNENTTGNYNVAMGNNALLSNTTANDNTALGRAALKNNTTGYENTATGSWALLSNTEGNFNSAYGRAAMYHNTEGNNNTAIGYESLNKNISGSSNVAIGTRALYNSTDRCNLVAIGDSALFNNGIGATVWVDGTSNTAVGSKSLYSNTTGYRNTANGYEALYFNTTGNNNSASGYRALYSNTTGKYNTANGYAALYNNTEGGDNTANGYYALQANTTGSSNTANGYSALHINSSGKCNTSNGTNALYSNTTGSYNTANGYSALYSNKTGNYNTAIGYRAGPDNVWGLYNTGAFGSDAWVQESNTIRIGNTSISKISGQVAWSYPSDGRFKTNVKANVPGLEFIRKLNPVTFNWDIHKLDRFKGVSDSIYAQSPKMEEARLQQEAKIYSGFIAQEVEEAANAVGYDFSGLKKPKNERSEYELAYSEFVVPLVKAVQEQQHMIEEMKKEIEDLKRQINQ